MSVTLLLAGALFAQSGNLQPVDDQERVDVAYEELAAGRNRAAVAKIRASDLDEEGDPSALINLGTAYARLGMRDEALACYRAAGASQERYDLQLADGSWVGSREAARMAIASLSGDRTLTMR